MFWADKLLENQKGKQIINDSFTPSGIVHMGSLKGPVIHDTLYRVLKQKKADVEFMYGFDDFDPIDGLPANLIESHSQYLGVPIYIAPSPDGQGSFGEYFGAKMEKLLERLGIEPKIYRTSVLYKEGRFDEAIKIVLDNVSKVREVYSAIYKKEISNDWFPLQVVCPNCGKLGTTKVTGWDGTSVKFVCSPNLVKWAEGCGFEGEMSPYGGNAKMPWKVEWAAKWYTFGVTIEGAGKDHASAGGSYDVAMMLVEKVFGKSHPLKLGYEFFLTGGKKMSSSKGLGLTGEELLEVFTPQAARFLMIRTRPEQAVEFDPRSFDIISRIYNDYQAGASDFSNNDKTDLARAFELSQIGDIEKLPAVRFSVLMQWVQMPNLDVEIEKENARAWSVYAKNWVDKYAPDEEKFVVQEKLPEEASSLSDEQKRYLSELASVVAEEINPEDLQTKIYELSKQFNIPSKEAFRAIYIALLGKDYGPKAAWLISSLDRDFLIERFGSASS